MRMESESRSPRLERTVTWPCRYNGHQEQRTTRRTLSCSTSPQRSCPKIGCLFGQLRCGLVEQDKVRCVVGCPGCPLQRHGQITVRTSRGERDPDSIRVRDSYASYWQNGASQVSVGVGKASAEISSRRTRYNRIGDGNWQTGAK